MQKYFPGTPKRSLPFLTSALIISTALMLAGFSCRRAPRQDNVLLITLDTQRADYISAYEPRKALTPHIDALAERGVLYENCFSLIPITLPAHASLFFSLPPHEIKNYNNGQIITRIKKRPSMASVFSKNGYTTAAFISLGVLKSEFGLDEGFELYEDEFPADRWYLPAAEVNTKVFPWLEEARTKNFFLWIHYSDPHDPYAPPYLTDDLELSLNGQSLSFFNLKTYKTYEVQLNLRPGVNELRFDIENDYVEDQDQFLGRLDKLEFQFPEDARVVTDLLRGWFHRPEDDVYFFKNNAVINIDNRAGPRKIRLVFRGKAVIPIEGLQELYGKEVEYMDGEIGKLWGRLESLALLEKTLIVVVGDHGEGLGEYTTDFGDPHVGHIHFLQDVYMKVPLILFDPRSSRKGIRIKEPVTLLDIAPTLLAAMGLPNLPEQHGRNLRKLKPDQDIIIFEETYKPEAVKDRFAIRHHPWHLIFTPEDKKYELYDLGQDPGELENLFGAGDLPAEVESMKRKLDALARQALRDKKDTKFDKDTEEMLRTLGYIK